MCIQYFYVCYALLSVLSLAQRSLISPYLNNGMVLAVFDVSDLKKKVCSDDRWTLFVTCHTFSFVGCLLLPAKAASKQADGS